MATAQRGLCLGCRHCDNRVRSHAHIHQHAPLRLCVRFVTTSSTGKASVAVPRTDRERNPNSRRTDREGNPEHVAPTCAVVYYGSTRNRAEIGVRSRLGHVRNLRYERVQPLRPPSRVVWVRFGVLQGTFSFSCSEGNEYLL